MKNTMIGSLEQYIKNVNRICFSNDGIANNKVYFRGEADVEWKQEASLFRGRFETESYTKEVNVALEKDLIDAAKIQCPQIFEDCTDSVSRLVRMQHYGLPTRLFDVTANPLVALYFACNSKPETDGKVLFTKAHITSLTDVNALATLAETIESYEDLINVDKLFKYWIAGGAISVEEKKINGFKKWFFENVTKSFLFQPVMDNDRIQRQQGAMIFSSLVSISPFSKLSRYKSLCRMNSYDKKMNEILFKKANVDLRDMFEKKEFVIKAENKKKLLQELDLVGINEGFVYPEAEHQLKTIKYQNLPKNELRF